MDNEINPIDDFLREAERAAKFLFKENDWARMSAKLDDEMPERKRRWAFFTWPSVAAIVLGLGIVGIASYRLLQPKPRGISEKEISDTATASNEFKVQEKSVLPNETSSDIKSNSSSANEITTSNKSTSFSAKANLPKVKNKHIKTVGIPTEFAETQTTNPSLNAEPKEHAVLSTRVSNRLKKNKTATPQTASNEKENTNRLAPNTIETGQAQAETPHVNAPVQWVQGKPMQALDTQVLHQSTRMSEDEMIRYNPRYVRELKQYEATRLDSVTVIRFKPATQAIPFMNQTLAKDSFLHTYRLQFLLGTMLWRGFVGGNTWTPAPYMSLGIDKALSKKLTLSAHVGFTYFAGLQTQNRSVSYRYKFGIDSTVYTALHKMVFRIQWPIQLKYAINKQHALAVGAGAAWQPDGISRVTAPVQVLNGGTAPSYNTPMQTKNQLGYMHGIRSWDGFFQFAYQYQWHERLALQILWQVGLRDMTDNQLLSSNRIQRNHGLMIGLRYGFVRNNR